MKILIDADGCPVTKIAATFAIENKIQCIIFCDTAHLIAMDKIKTIVVSKGADSVDFALLSHLSEGDIVITQDYGLAAMCLAKKSFPINQNGLVYTNSNIDEILFFRHIAKEQRKFGERVKGAKKRNKIQDEIFLKSLKMLVGSIGEK